ncbi:hypothetical protein [Paludibacterium denitrificans]|uniref:Uncharacterized protein n=1 Tax=Paludibacterium denitrificans TaxID=2675226 RepID=A0A844GAG0_9NEIS|nr:hypothetical protein [Paludibacterium denitrificans]MTD33383.1 hypothetical protein [Paludibacterium denitrificans]
MVNKDPEVGWNDENVLLPQFRLADEIRLLVFSQHFYRLVVFMLQQVFCAKINKTYKNQ